MATRAFEVASSSAAGAALRSPGAEIAGRAISNRNAALHTSAKIFRIMQKLLFIFNFDVCKTTGQKIRRRRCGAASGCDPSRHTRYSKVYKDTRAALLGRWGTKSLSEPQAYSLHLYTG